MSVTILDGGMGKELRRIGAPFRQPEWSALALMDAPDFVRQAHANFVAAGAEVIITNTYSVIPHHIGDDRFASSGYSLASLAGRIARTVADEARTPVRVAGSLPPLFGSYDPDAFDASLAPGLWRVLIDALDPWVDLWVGETIGSLAEFEMIASLLSDDNRPRWASFALADTLTEGEARLRTGEGVTEIAAVAGPLCDAILFNCSQPEVISAAVGPLVAALGDGSIEVGAYANAFQPGATEGNEYESNEVILERRPDLTPQRYAEFVDTWVADGATIVGGCCDIYPDHIAEIARRHVGGAV